VRREAANVHLARGNDGIVDANMPTRNSDVEGSDEQWQIDIRPLPGYVRYGDIICTVLVVVIADRGSGKIWAGRLIPGVKVVDGKETDEEVWSGDYKAQEIRDLIATAIWRAKRCFRILYPDNGSHFKKVVLGPYMPYLASKSRDGSQVYQPRLEKGAPAHRSLRKQQATRVHLLKQLRRLLHHPIPKPPGKQNQSNRLAQKAHARRVNPHLSLLS
jgi:hypothetical protein